MTMGYGGNAGVKPQTATTSPAPSPVSSSFMPVPPAPAMPAVFQQSGNADSAQIISTLQLLRLLLLIQPKPLLFLPSLHLLRHPLGITINIQRVTFKLNRKRPHSGPHRSTYFPRRPPVILCHRMLHPPPP